MTDSLFGHLAYRFSSSPENLATEALNFILNSSLIAQDAFIDLLKHLDILMPSNLRFDTQYYNSETGSIPDLVGINSAGKVVLFGEAKFWAGLTNKQPVSYLNELINSNGKLLIFFAPTKRIPTLWPELLRRCNEANFPIAILKEDPDIRIVKIQEDQFLVLLSWKALINSIHQHLIVEGELEMAGNLVQLQGLCDLMDETAFLPLQSEELTSDISRRLGQYCDLVDEVTKKLASERFASIQGNHAQGTRNGYNRYMKIGKHGVSLEYNHNLWTKYRATPLWLGIFSEAWTYDVNVKITLASLETEKPARLFSEAKATYVPIFLKFGVEKSVVVKLIIDQIKKVFELLDSDQSYNGNQHLKVIQLQ